MKSKISEQARNALFIGSLCSVAYLSVYIVRNVLSAVTPQITDAGIYTEEFIGTMSSLFFIAYGIGQLINGMIGDKIKAKYMISVGLLLAGISNLLFPVLAQFPYANLVAYGITGFFLSMIYGPMTKLVSENTTPLHAVRCSLGYTLASLLGSPIAGLLAATLAWRSVFTVSSSALIIMAILCLTLFTLFEKRKIVQYGRFQATKSDTFGIKQLLDRHIVKFSIIAILTGIVRTSVVFWLPTYFNQYLGFSPNDSAYIFTIATLVIASSAFIAVFLCERLHNDMHKTVLILFIGSAISFALSYLIYVPLFNIVCMILAVLCANGASAILWSIYCPSLRDTGIVSSVTGFLDFLSYIGAAIANYAFANLVGAVGWKNLLLIWFGLMTLGAVICLPIRRRRNPQTPVSQKTEHL